MNNTGASSLRSTADRMAGAKRAQEPAGPADTTQSAPHHIHSRDVAGGMACTSAPHQHWHEGMQLHTARKAQSGCTAPGTPPHRPARVRRLAQRRAEELTNTPHQTSETQVNTSWCSAGGKGCTSRVVS
jgi:hypothetical protein